MVVVYIPLRNGEKYILKAISSVLSQGYSDFELRIVENGSRDSSREIIKQFIGTIQDPRITSYDNSQNPGIANNWNWCIRNCNRKYFVLLHQDDELCPDYLATMIDFMEEHREYSLSYCDTVIINKEGNLTTSISDIIKRYYRKHKISLDTNLKELFKIPLIPCPTIVYRKSSVDKIGCFNESYRNELDWEYQLRTVLMGHQIGYVNKRLYRYRRHGTNENVKNTHNLVKYIEIKKMVEELYDKFADVISKQKIKKSTLLSGLKIILLKDIIVDIAKMRTVAFKKIWFMINIILPNHRLGFQRDFGAK